LVVYFRIPFCYKRFARLPYQAWRMTRTVGVTPMFDTALMFLVIVATLGAGGVLGLLSMLCMAVEVWSNDW